MRLNISISYNIENKIHLKQGVRSPGEKPRKNDRLSFPFSFCYQIKNKLTEKDRQALRYQHNVSFPLWRGSVLFTN